MRKGSDVNEPPAGTQGMNGYSPEADVRTQPEYSAYETLHASHHRTAMRRFALERMDDETGISGTGMIAEGVEFSNGVCVVNWLTKYRSQGVYPSLKEVQNIHGHNGKTLVVWFD